VRIEHTSHERLDLVGLAEVDADYLAAPAEGLGGGAGAAEALDTTTNVASVASAAVSFITILSSPRWVRR